MEKDSMLCSIREVQRAIHKFELDFEALYGISLNEGMLLCTLSKNIQMSSGELCNILGLTHSNGSKVISSAEKKGLVERVLGKRDKRQMLFSLTQQGKELLSGMSCGAIELPDLLKDIVKDN